MESELAKVTKLWWHVFLRHVQSTRLTKTPDQVCNNPVKVDVVSPRSEYGIPKQHLLWASPIWEPYKGKVLHTFIEQCYDVLEKQLFHSTLSITTADRCRLYVYVASQKQT